MVRTRNFTRRFGQHRLGGMETSEQAMPSLTAWESLKGTPESSESCSAASEPSNSSLSLMVVGFVLLVLVVVAFWPMSVAPH